MESINRQEGRGIEEQLRKLVDELFAFDARVSRLRNNLPTEWALEHDAATIEDRTLILSQIDKEKIELADKIVIMFAKEIVRRENQPAADPTTSNESDLT